MRLMKTLLVALLLTMPVLAIAASDNIPGSAVWYFHLDLEQMRKEGASKGVYDWLNDEALSEVSDEAGVDVDKELDSLTAFSTEGQGPVILFEGSFSQDTKDKVMAMIASDGNLDSSKVSGKTYFQFQGEGDNKHVDLGDNNIELDFDSLQEEAWVSLDLKDKILITHNEEQMRSMLANNGKISGQRGHNGALLVLTAEKALLQASMNSRAIGNGDGGGFDSSILKNTEQVAFLMAAAANKLALEAKLVTTEPEMATQLASVVRGLISLMAFNDEMDSETAAMLQGTKVEAKGNSLSLSLAIDPDLVVQTLGD